MSLGCITSMILSELSCDDLYLAALGFMIKRPLFPRRTFLRESTVRVPYATYFLMPRDQLEQSELILLAMAIQCKYHEKMSDIYTYMGVRMCVCVCVYVYSHEYIVDVRWFSGYIF